MNYIHILNNKKIFHKKDRIEIKNNSDLQYFFKNDICG